MKQVVNLGMGQIAFTSKPVIIRTVIGGCVAITMYDKRTHFSAMCHALYLGEENCCLYAINSVEKMMGRFTREGIILNHLEVKMFGASTSLGETARQKADTQEKMKTLKHKIEEQGITIRRQDLGGTETREILFDTETGAVYLRYLKKSMVNPGVSDE